MGLIWGGVLKLLLYVIKVEIYFLIGVVKCMFVFGFLFINIYLIFGCICILLLGVCFFYNKLM